MFYRGCRPPASTRELDFMRTIATWILTVLVAAAFIYAGYSKLTSAPAMIELFRSFGYPSWSMFFTGALEIFGAAFLFVPRYAFAGAGLLACIMLGALFSHLTHGQADKIGPPIVLLILTLVLGTLHNWGRPVRFEPSPFTKY
jgi:putative oxidoreductase